MSKKRIISYVVLIIAFVGIHKTIDAMDSTAVDTQDLTDPQDITLDSPVASPNTPTDQDLEEYVTIAKQYFFGLYSDDTAENQRIFTDLAEQILMLPQLNQTVKQDIGYYYALLNTLSRIPAHTANPQRMPRDCSNCCFDKATQGDFVCSLD